MGRAVQHCKFCVRNVELTELSVIHNPEFSGILARLGEILVRVVVSSQIVWLGQDDFKRGKKYDLPV